MKNGLCLTVFLCTAFLLMGCGEEIGEGTIDTRTYTGAFNMIIDEVSNMQSNLASEYYTGRDAPIEDQLGSAVHAFKTNEDVKGTPLEAEVQKLADWEEEMMNMWRSNTGSIEKYREIGQQMADQVEHIKTLI